LLLIQIVPNLPPKVDGIDDHAFRLAERLREFHGIQTSFIVCNPKWNGPSDITGFNVIRLPSRNDISLVRTIQELTPTGSAQGLAVLLQFAPYGYAAKGYPAWIIRGIRKIRSSCNVPIITMFHELDVGKRKPWTSAFWIAPFQRTLLRKLVQNSTCRITNTQFHRTKLSEWGATDVSLVPSFSTIGEPSVNPDFSERKRQLVVFGRPWQRKLTYDRGRHLIGEIHKLIGLEQITDIGDPIPGDDAATLEGLPIIRRGRLHSSDISHLMSFSIASLLSYPIPLLTKSSIYGAICAHGTLPFIISESSSCDDKSELESGIDYILAELSLAESLPGDLAAFSARLSERYHSRSSMSAARHIASLCMQFYANLEIH